MDAAYVASVINTLQNRGVLLEPGLTSRQIEAVEEMHSFRFPPDLRALLETALPVGRTFPDWRAPNSASIGERLSWPADGICFDIEHNDFWFEKWCPRPGSVAEAQAKAREEIRKHPALIPIFSHRYLPATPCEAGNPCFPFTKTMSSITA